MDIADLTAKYTGHRIDDSALLAAHRAGGLTAALAHAVERAATTVTDVETELARVADSVADSTAKVRENLDAAAGQRVRTLNSIGELQANAPRASTH